jgi:hypothetical protein
MTAGEFVKGLAYFCLLLYLPPIFFDVSTLPHGSWMMNRFESLRLQFACLAKFMRHGTLILLVMMVGFLLPACAKKTRHDPNPQSRPFNMERNTPRISPNRCRLIGTVVAIDSTYKPANPNEPCAKAPCHATVRVDSVLGYGPAFPQPLANGQLISVAFAFTLSPTQNLFMNMAQSYPGLKIGSKFLAEVEANAEPELGATKPVAFVIYEYAVK